MLKKGDAVVMHNCIEAEKYNGRIWICQYDEFTAPNGRQAVYLEDFNTFFYVEFLRKI